MRSFSLHHVRFGKLLGRGMNLRLFADKLHEAAELDNVWRLEKHFELQYLKFFVSKLDGLF